MERDSGLLKEISNKEAHWGQRKALTSRKRTSCPPPSSSSQPSNCNVRKTMRRGFGENCRSPVLPRVPLGEPILFVLLSVQMLEKCHRRFQNIHKQNNRCSHSFKHLLRDLPVGPGSGKASKALILAQNFRGAKRNGCNSQDRYYSRPCLKKPNSCKKKSMTNKMHNKLSINGDVTELHSNDKNKMS